MLKESHDKRTLTFTHSGLIFSRLHDDLKINQCKLLFLSQTTPGASRTLRRLQ